jgi:hypothetical protein
VALRLFVDNVQAQEPILEVSENLIEHQAVVSELITRVDALFARFEATATRIDEISGRLDDVRGQLEKRLEADRTSKDHLRRVEAHVARLDRGLTGLRPLMWLTRLIARWPVLTVLVVLQIVAYGLTAFTAPAEYRLLSLAGGGLLTLVAAITFWAQMRTPGPTTPPTKN